MIFVMAQSKSLADRLRVYGVLRIAEEVAHAHRAKVADLAREGSARSELVQRLVDAGWSSANVARVLDANKAGDGGKDLADGGTRRDGRLSSGRAASASEEVEREGSRRSDGSPDAPAARASSPRTSARAIVAPASPPVAVLAAGDGGPPRAEAQRREATARERVVRLPLAGTANVLPLHERPRMFPGRGVRYDDCVNTSDCLGRAVAAEPKIKAVHCPPYCKFRETAGFEQRLAEVSTASRGKFEC